MTMHSHPRLRWRLGLALIPLAGLLLGACGGGGDDPTPAGSPDATSATATQAVDLRPGAIPTDSGRDDNADLTGAGATFPAPLYQAWFDEYNHSVAKNVRINYQSIGSGGGIQQFTAGTVDFGASDAPMSDEELAAAADTQHLPTVLGAVVVTYNLADADVPLRLDGPAVAGIYLGEITKWNDPAIASLNPGVELPGDDIQVVHRSDGSGTSFVFTDWLTKVSPEWANRVGANKNPNWPTGQGGKGNEGVTNAVRQTPNSIGYVELNYAIENDLPFANVKNRAGEFITPSIESTSAAAANAALPDDYRVSITDPEGAGAYPIASFTYLLVPKSSGKCSAMTPLAHFLNWAYNDPAAAGLAAELHYAPLPESARNRVNETLAGITCDGGKPALG
ncbi:MAG: phosphate ABC transporter substrate-binding protein PstS [Hyphomicrobiales bacterium]